MEDEEGTGGVTESPEEETHDAGTSSLSPETVTDDTVQAQIDEEGEVEENDVTLEDPAGDEEEEEKRRVNSNTDDGGENVNVNIDPDGPPPSNSNGNNNRNLDGFYARIKAVIDILKNTQAVTPFYITYALDQVL